MSSLIEHLKAKADSRNREAIDVLEARGFNFLAHYGCQNAADRKEAMDQAMSDGLLFEFLQSNFGIPLT